MPAIVQIVRSDAMVSWSDARLDHPVGWWTGGRPLSATPVPALLRTPDACHWTALSALTDDDLIGYVVWADRLPPNALDLDVLARELTLRVAGDSGFSDRLLALASTTTLVGRLTARADFPAVFLAGVVTAMMWPHGPQSTVDLDGYAASLATAMSGLLHEPAACLDLLLDPAVLYGIASWERLDTDIVTEFTLAGLYDAVEVDPHRLVDGYRVIATLTTIANGPLDHGVTPGMAVGVAGSMVGYIPTLAPALGFEATSRSVVIVDGGPPIVKPPKTVKSRRTVELDGRTLSMLSEWRRTQLEERLRAGEAWNPGEWVVADELGAYLRPDRLGKRFVALSRAAGLRTITIRQLRHSHATALLSAGESPKVVQERLGHSSISVTLDVYSAVLPYMQREAVERLSEMFVAC
jgi:hypothetical protein